MDEYFIRTEHLCCNYRDENGREAPALIDINRPRVKYISTAKT
jgi:hypothetical protein